jgi:hypothetical protein
MLFLKSSIGGVASCNHPECVIDAEFGSFLATGPESDAFVLTAGTI